MSGLHAGLTQESLHSWVNISCLWVFFQQCHSKSQSCLMQSLTVVHECSGASIGVSSAFLGGVGGHGQAVAKPPFRLFPIPLQRGGVLAVQH